MSDAVLGGTVLGVLIAGLVGFYRFQLRRTWRRSLLWTLATLLTFVAVVFLEAK